jgi:hypothetical protein
MLFDFLIQLRVFGAWNTTFTFILLILIPIVEFAKHLKQLRRNSTSDITYGILPLLNPKGLYHALSYYLVDGSRMRQIDNSYRFKIYVT